MAWFSLFGAIPTSAGGSAIRDEKPFVFEDRVHQQLVSIYKFLNETKVIDVDKPAAGALDDSAAQKVAKSANVPLPLGTIKAQDVSKAPK